MEYRKEREYIKAYNDNGKYMGGFNLTDGTFQTPAGNATIKKPTGIFLRAHDNEFYAQAVVRYRLLAHYDGFNSNRYEALISVGLIPCSARDTSDRTKLSKELVEYLKNNHNGWYSTDYVQTYKIITKYNLNPEEYNIAEYFEFSNINETVIKLIRRCILEHVNEVVSTYVLSDYIREYIRISKEMYGEVKVVPNFMTNYYQLKYLYKLYTRTNMNKMVEENNNCPWLYYENDEYTVFPLLSSEAFHEEATAQNNCVERLYLEKVAHGRTHVVVVRKKDNPEKSFITCEVSKQHNIVQYLLSNNRNVQKDTSEWNFEKEYAEYLKSSLME